MSNITYPIIDLAEYGLGPHNAKDVSTESLMMLGDKAIHTLRTSGYCYLKNHGVSEKLINDFLQISRKFFDQPEEIKSQTPLRKDFWTGWAGYGDEALNPKRPTDLKELFHLTPGQALEKWPAIENFETIMNEMFRELSSLALRFLEALSVGLGKPKDFLGNAHSLMGKRGSTTGLRTLYYPPLSKATEIRAGAVRCGEHTDYGTFAFVFQDDAGLEVKVPSGEYVSVPCIPGTLVFNTGGLLQRWTSDTIRATEHRVMNPKDETTREKSRQSIVFYVVPDDDFVIESLDDSKKYPPINVLDYMKNRFQPAITNN